jgi:hypothetical protein
VSRNNILRRLETRPTGYRRAFNTPPEVLAEVSFEKIQSISRNTAEEWRAELRLGCSFTVSHPDAVPECRARAEREFIAMLYRDIEEPLVQAMRHAQAVKHLAAGKANHHHDALERRLNQIYRLVRGDDCDLY